MVQDRWTSIDFPVLLAVAEQAEEQPGAMTINYTAVRERCSAELTEQEFVGSIAYLDAGRYLTAVLHNAGGMAHRTIVSLEPPTEKGLRAVRAWPDGDPFAALMARLAEMESAELDPEKKSRIARLSGALGSVGKEVFTEVIAKVIAHVAGAG